MLLFIALGALGAILNRLAGALDVTQNRTFINMITREYANW